MIIGSGISLLTLAQMPFLLLNWQLTMHHLWFVFFIVSCLLRPVMMTQSRSGEMMTTTGTARIHSRDMNQQYGPLISTHRATTWSPLALIKL